MDHGLEESQPAHEVKRQLTPSRNSSIRLCLSNERLVELVQLLRNSRDGKADRCKIQQDRKRSERVRAVFVEGLDSISAHDSKRRVGLT